MIKIADCMKGSIILTGLFICFSLFALTGAYGQGHKEAAQNNSRIRLEGTLRLVGNEPFTSLILTDSGGQDWYIDAKDQKELLLLQQQHVVIEGTLTVKKMILADGRELPDRKIVSDITIIKK